MTERDNSEALAKLSFEEMADQIREFLGSKRAAFIAFYNPEILEDKQEIKPESYSHLLDGRTKPTGEIQTRIKNTHQVIDELLFAGEYPDVISVWFDIPNPELDGRSPALAIITDPQDVKIAAKSFIENDRYDLAL